jgi:hypothetical protein
MPVRPTPHLVGLSIAAANEAVHKLGDFSFEVIYQDDANFLGPAALVARQRPDPGAPMTMGDGVEVYVGVKVPDFRGKTLAEATAIASKLRLSLFPLQDVGPTAGPIETQDPPKGTVVEIPGPTGAVVRVGVKEPVAPAGPTDGGPEARADAGRVDAGSRDAGVAGAGEHSGVGPSGTSHEPPQKVATAGAGPTEVASQPTGGVVQTGRADGGSEPLTRSVPPTIPPTSPPSWLYVVLALTAVVGLVITGTARWQRGGSRDAERSGLNPAPPSVTIKPHLGSGHFEVRDSAAAVARSLRVRGAAEPSQPRVIGDDRGEVKVTVRRTDG